MQNVLSALQTDLIFYPLEGCREKSCVHEINHSKHTSVQHFCITHALRITVVNLSKLFRILVLKYEIFLVEMGIEDTLNRKVLMSLHLQFA